MAEEKKNNYKSETKASLINFIYEIGNFVFVIITAIATMSISIFMDVINSSCNLIRAGFTTFLSKRLQKSMKYKYNYGTEKLETLSMIFCDALLLLGVIVIFGFAIYQTIFPKKVEDSLLWGVIFKSVSVFTDIFLIAKDYSVYKKTKTKVAKTTFKATFEASLFDFAIFLSVISAYIFKRWAGVVYIEPIASIILAMFIIASSIKNAKTYIKELVDVTLPESDQLKIDRILNKYYNKYQDFFSVNSHFVNEKVYIDFHISFTDNTTYKEIQETLSLISADLDKVFAGCKVSLILDGQ